MSGSGCENKISIDPNGDRTLIVGAGEKQKLFRVSSKAMCLASPVWKAMLTGSFVEATAEDISLPEADPDALLIALRIAHLQFKDLPSSLSFPELVNLAAVCDVYDLVPIARPFSANWIKAAEPLVDVIGNEQWLSVAWTFGNVKMFERIARRLVLHARTNADGQCLNEENKVLEDLMPPGIIDGILSARDSAISDIINICRLHLELFESNTYQNCKANVDMAKCDSLTLGSLVKGFEPLGLWRRRPNASEILISVSQLAAAIRDIQIHTYLEDVVNAILEVSQGISTLENIAQSNSYNRYLRDAENTCKEIKGHLDTLYKKTSRPIHSGCSFKAKFDRGILRITNNMPSAVLDSYIRHMEEQSKK